MNGDHPVFVGLHVRTVIAREDDHEDRLVMKSGHKFDFTKTPYVVWFRIYSTALGTGNCHVELSANGRPVGSKSFTVVEAE